VQRQIGIVAMAAMDERTADEYEKMMEKEPMPSPEEVVNFLQNKIPNFQEVLTEALKQFADEYITGAKRLMAEAKAGSAVSV